MGDDGQVVAGVICVVVLILVGIPCGSIYLNQCVFGCGDSLHVRVTGIRLLTHPTDNVLFGWEWLFGKPHDEIRIHVFSGWCSARTRGVQRIKEGGYITPDVEINTYFDNGFSFRLEEQDGGLEGKNDYSKYVNVPEEKMASMREAFDNKLTEHIALDYLVTVKGRNIFQENRWFGFLAENLCINVLDFITGPWTSKLFKLGKTIVFKSREIARLYKTVKQLYKRGELTKKSIFKALITHLIREGVKDGFFGSIKDHVMDSIKDWALNQTHVDEQIMTIVKGDPVSYVQLNSEIDTGAGFLGGLTDKLEFCLSGILPPSRDALYHVSFGVTR